MNCIAIIPARGGSVRIHGKNIKSFFGKPIIAYSIETARASGLFDEIVVSTDCMSIAEVARQYGAAIFERPKDDGARGTQEVAREVLLSPKYKYAEEACVIYATSPLLLASDLRGVRVHLAADVAYVMSVQRAPLADAGCFYYGWAAAFRASIPLIDTSTVMFPLPARRVCDINTPEDWIRAEKLYQLLEGGK